MEILANQELAAFWSTVLRALEMATYVFGGVFVLVFVLLALMEFRDRKGQHLVAPVPVPEPRRSPRPQIDTEKKAQADSVDSQYGD